MAFGNLRFQLVPAPAGWVDAVGCATFDLAVAAVTEGGASVPAASAATLKMTALIGVILGMAHADLGVASARGTVRGQ